MLTKSRGGNPLALEEEFMAVFKTIVVGTIHLFNLFMPLILKGQQKKVVYITSGLADLDLISKHDVAMNASYSVGKAAANTVGAKFSAVYAKDGVLFMSISPGVVDTGNIEPSKSKRLCTSKGKDETNTRI